MAGRMRAGSQLAGKSWRILRGHPWMIAAVGLGALAAWAVAFGAFLLAFHRLPNSDDSRFPQYLLVIPFFWIASFFSNCIACLITIVVDAELRGEPITRAEAVRRTASKLGAIIAWTLTAGVVFLLLFVIAERLHLAGTITRHFLGLVWALATVFVIPVLVLEGVPVRRSLRRSAALFKSTWAEKVTADVSVIGVIFIAMLPAATLVGALGFVSLTAAIMVGGLLLALLSATSGALDTVVVAATYRYALDGQVSGALSDTDIRSLYKPA